MIALALVLQVVSTANGPDDTVLSTARNFVRISERLATSGQISAQHIDVLAQQGFSVVVNLATADAERNGQEGFWVAEKGMTYVNIPVSWQEPTLEDLDQFFAVMDANRDRKVFVHCFANMRASAFTYLYRTLKAGVPEVEARRGMVAVWDPSSDENWAQWDRLIRLAREERPRQ